MGYSRHSRRLPSLSASRSRSRSPRTRTSSHRHSHRRRQDSIPTSRRVDSIPPSLPFDAIPLSKHDLARYESMFGMYLDIQKGIDISELSEREVKGRWKSFMGKWNRGDLAEGWYDPNTFEKARDSAFTRDPSEPRSSRRDASLWKRRSGSYGEDTWRNRLVTPRDLDRVQDTQRTGLPEQAISPRETTEDEEEDGDEESYGPQIPTEHTSSSPSRAPKRIDKSGPKIPTIQDLQLQRESHLSSLQETREAQRLSHKQSLKSHKSHLHQFEEETAPRAEPGTRERRLEKRREVASSNRAFAESRRGASPGEAPEAELMGDEGGDLETLKRQREKEVRKKNEREIRKEELLRARAAEREERLKSFRRKEEETMSYLRALAKEKFG